MIGMAHLLPSFPFKQVLCYELQSVLHFLKDTRPIFLSFNAPNRLLLMFLRSQPSTNSFYVLLMSTRRFGVHIMCALVFQSFPCWFNKILACMHGGQIFYFARPWKKEHGGNNVWMMMGGLFSFLKPLLADVFPRFFLGNLSQVSRASQGIWQVEELPGLALRRSPPFSVREKGAMLPAYQWQTYLT